MKIQEYVKKFNKSFEEIKNLYSNDYQLLYDEEKNWLINLEDKLDLLEDKTKIKDIKQVITKLKSNEDFTNDNLEVLLTFIAQINSIVRIANRINNFKEGKQLDDGSKLNLVQLFNKIKNTDRFENLHLNLNSNLNVFLVHLYSIVKHCQDPDNYLIYYRYWKNIAREVFSKKDDYDSLCDIYRSIPQKNRHLNFALYFGTIGIRIAKEIKDFKPDLDISSKEYNYLIKKVLNLEYMQLLLNNELKNVKTGNKFKMNYKDNYIKWMKNNNATDNSRKIDSYIKAIEILSEKLTYEIFEINALSKLNDLYQDLLLYQGDENGKYYHSEKPSYGKNRFYSASIKSYIEFHKSSDTKKIKDFKEGNRNLKLNTILYGPPGTGKTYNTINKTLEIIDGSVPELRSDAKDKFKSYQESGQIEFVTFHQSYGYEEFVEGIKALSPDDERNPTDNLIYKVEDGVFKKLSNNAKPIKVQTNKLNFDWTYGNIFKMSLGGKNDSRILDWCLENNYISMGWGNEIDFSKVSAQSWETFRDESKSLFIDIEPDRFTIQAMYAFKEWMKKNDLVFISLGNLKIVAIAQVIGDYEYKDSIDEIGYSQFRKVKWLFIDKSGIPVDKLLTKKLSQQTIYNIDKSYVKKDFLDFLFGEKEHVEDKNYVLIIDEINRGNISKIFGELITLIEDSKRAGNDEEVELILPYSNQSFSVPNNLYILGTMNTADRSIALMDTALRRRFHFEEMMPNLELLNDLENMTISSREEGIAGDTINVKELLNKINLRIEYLYDRDHTIGHAYFLSLKDKKTENARFKELGNIFRNKIIPLLQEYFYDDWEKIQIVLGDHPKQFKKKNINKNYEYFQFIKSTELNESDILGLNHDDIEDNSIDYKINSYFSSYAYKKIYDGYKSVLGYKNNFDFVEKDTEN